MVDKVAANFAFDLSQAYLKALLLDPQPAKKEEKVAIRPKVPPGMYPSDVVALDGTVLIRFQYSLTDPSFNNSLGCDVCFKHIRIGDKAFVCGRCNKWFCVPCYYQIATTMSQCGSCRQPWFQFNRDASKPKYTYIEEKKLPDDIKEKIPDAETPEFYVW